MTPDPAAERIDAHLDAIDTAADWTPEPTDEPEPDILRVSEWAWRGWARVNGRPCDEREYLRLWFAAYERQHGELDGDRAPF